MSTPALSTPAADRGGRRRDGRENEAGIDGDDPSGTLDVRCDGDESGDPGLADRRKIIHRTPSAEGDPESSDRRKTVHQEPNVEGDPTPGRGKRRTRFEPATEPEPGPSSAVTPVAQDPPNPHDPPTREGDDSHGSVCCEADSVYQDEARRDALDVGGPINGDTDEDPDRRSQRDKRRPPDSRRRDAERLGGIRATPAEERAVRQPALDGDPADGGEGSGGRGVGTAPVSEDPVPERRRRDRCGRERGRGALVRTVARTLMLLALVGTALGPALPQHHEDHGHVGTVEVHQASLGSGLFSLWALASARIHALQGWNALAAPEKCQDCNLDVDNGCRCVCYSGGFDPDDPACQF